MTQNLPNPDETPRPKVRRVKRPIVVDDEDISPLGNAPGRKGSGGGMMQQIIVGLVVAVVVAYVMISFVGVPRADFTSNLSALVTELGAVKQAQVTQTGSISSIQNDVAFLKNNPVDLSTLASQTDLASLTTTVASLQSSLDEANATVTAQEERIVALETAKEEETAPSGIEWTFKDYTLNETSSVSVEDVGIRITSDAIDNAGTYDVTVKLSNHSYHLTDSTLPDTVDNRTYDSWTGYIELPLVPDNTTIAVKEEATSLFLLSSKPPTMYTDWDDWTADYITKTIDKVNYCRRVIFTSSDFTIPKNGIYYIYLELDLVYK